MRFAKAVPLRSLKLFNGNPRQHGEEDVSAIVRSIETFGWTNPILVQEKTNRVIAGHGRIEAAHKAGLKSVPAIYLTMTNEQADAYTIGDNRIAELSAWDLPKLKDLLAELDGQSFDLESIGYTDAEIDKLLATEPRKKTVTFQATDIETQVCATCGQPVKTPTP